MKTDCKPRAQYRYQPKYKYLKGLVVRSFLFSYVNTHTKIEKEQKRQLT